MTNLSIDVVEHGELPVGDVDELRRLFDRECFHDFGSWDPDQPCGYAPHELPLIVHSDIDLLVDAPPGTSSFAFIRFKQLIEKVVGREINLVSYGGLKENVDDDIRRDAVLL